MPRKNSTTSASKPKPKTKLEQVSAMFQRLEEVEHQRAVLLLKIDKLCEQRNLLDSEITELRDAVIKEIQALGLINLQYMMRKAFDTGMEHLSGGASILQGSAGGLIGTSRNRY